MDGIEPEIGLMKWVAWIAELWGEEKEIRDAQCQELYEQIEPLWERLKVDPDEIQKFIDENRGSGENTYLAVSMRRNNARSSQLTCSTRRSSSVFRISARVP